MNEYETSDLGIASYLLAIDQNLLRLVRDNPRRILFVFERSAITGQAVKNYWDGTAQVPPLKLLMSQKTIKARIYADQKP